jgi:hypothetical protein
MYDRIIPVFSHGLTAMTKVLEKAEAHCAARRIDPAVLLGFRLFPDMLSFTRQIQIATDHARRGPARLLGIEPLAMADTETGFAELRDRLARTLNHLAGFSAGQFQGTETATVVLKVGGRELTMSGTDYVGIYALPNFYFHLTTAYNILRHNGVELGKSDFLGG